MNTTTRLAVAGGGMLVTLVMTAGAAQAAPAGDRDDVKAACETFNRVGAQTGLWEHHDCSSWRADQHASVTIVRQNGTVTRTAISGGADLDFQGWPFTGLTIDLPRVVNVNGPAGAVTVPVPPKARPH
ncbi:hypothetical protein GCM10010168_58850 [Actinoplanes ianthinogenes]|uniref:Uncharacterized protein n=1 Tax=Actinoplanes ianthinogenes TaxID=122358 RepID=A0ABN6CL29_9ACTN|nr:hypothetical protein [Actinoplanes ianthinogenes]BCJ45694.1 hypothetical protein Aiant_63510 [Actinoplanes ianthinogenes]GGR32624.1 hypothetical protein GCM10010168_58850 [Actinoplanes ianthinogenes]